jgi:hypothetical protein
MQNSPKPQLLGGYVQPEQLQDVEQHQLRRPRTPISTPIATAPAIAPIPIHTSWTPPQTAGVFSRELLEDFKIFKLS